MQYTSSETLEFEALRNLIGRYIASPLGKGELAKMHPGTDRAVLEEILAETAEGIGYLRSASQPQPAGRGAAIRINFSQLPDLTQTIYKLKIEGAALDSRELFDVISLLDRAADTKSVLTATAERFPRLGARAATIGDFRPLLRDLEGPTVWQDALTWIEKGGKR